jgi:glycosyltransferase involved in cell wall biosynthesis
LAERADIIIAISNNTKNDIVDVYGINPDKIKVVYLGNSLVPASARLEQSKIDKDYILFVGKRGYYKNFNFFISSIAYILKKEKDLSLICAGGDAFNSEELATFNLLGISNKVQYRFVDETILAELYKNALFFVFPSLYEGFGIPVLESFACSCPIILSNRGSLPEVGGAAAIYIDPDNKDDIVDKVERMLYDKNLRQEMIKNGKLQLEKFSWVNTVDETEAIYRGLL